MAQPIPKREDNKAGFHMFTPGPVIDTPFTRLTEHWLTQQGTVCQDYELDYIRCSARVGGMRAENECSKFLEDFLECRHKFKTQKRHDIMRSERKKQKRPHLDTPPADSVYTPIGFD